VGHGHGDAALDTQDPELVETPPDEEQSPYLHDDVMVSRGLRIAAAWSWRLLAVAVAVGAVLWLLAYVRLIVVPLIIALLLSTLPETPPA